MEEGMKRTWEQAMASSSSIEGDVLLATADGAELRVSKELLCRSSRFFAGLLESCQTDKLKVDETREALEPLLTVLQGKPLPSTYDTTSMACWNAYKGVLHLADKYDMDVVQERVEKWLVSRCLRGRIECAAYGMHDHVLAFEWLAMCDKYGLTDLQWYMAHELGRLLAGGSWAALLRDCLGGPTGGPAAPGTAGAAAAAGAGRPAGPASVSADMLRALLDAVVKHQGALAQAAAAGLATAATRAS